MGRRSAVSCLSILLALVVFSVSTNGQVLYGSIVGTISDPQGSFVPGVTVVATNTEVLDAEIALLQAELDRTRAVASSRLAEARLERARGR